MPSRALDAFRKLIALCGLATIYDKDMLIYCIGKLMHRKNNGEPDRRVGAVAALSAARWRTCVATRDLRGDGSLEDLGERLQQQRSGAMTGCHQP